MMNRWSQRRAAVAAAEQAEAEARAAALEAERAEALARTQDEMSDEELLAEHGLPDPDTLAMGDDFRQFLAKTVPARLKNRALRRMWRVNPVLANLDGLVDYDQDFTDSAVVVPNMQTAYQVGKGMLAHVQELARQAEALGVTETAAEAPADETPPAPEALPEEPPAAEPVQIAAAEDTPVARAPRRMQFTFDAEATG